MKPALGSSPLGTPPRATRALTLLTAGHAPGRRMRSLLVCLRGTLHGYSERTLRDRFGDHVDSLLSELTRLGQVEKDLGGRVRLTAAGRARAREAVRP